MELIEFYERDVEEKYSHTEQFQQSLSAPYQQLCKPQQSNNLPAFETLFKGNRHSTCSNNVNRLSNVMSDSEDDEESSSICRKGKRGTVMSLFYYIVGMLSNQCRSFFHLFEQFLVM